MRRHQKLVHWQIPFIINEIFFNSSIKRSIFIVDIILAMTKIQGAFTIRPRAPNRVQGPTWNTKHAPWTNKNARFVNDHFKGPLNYNKH